MKSYDHLYFSRLSVDQSRASRCITHLYRTSEWKVMTIWISRELPLLNFEGLDILCALIRHLSERLWEFEFLESFRCSIFSFSIYFVPEYDVCVKSYDHLNSRELLLFNFERLDILCPWNDIRVKSYDHLYFSRLFVVEFLASRYIMSLNRTFEWKLMTTWILESFRSSISSV